MEQSERSARPRGRPRGASDAEVLDVARTILLSSGLAGMTMDVVAARARVSKGSLYRDHGSKDALFAAVVSDWVDRGRDAMRPSLDKLLEAVDVDAALLRFAVVLQAAVLSPEVAGMRALVAAEADRFPDVARGYLENSWHRNIASLADAFATLQHRRLLREGDPAVAAKQFTWMVVGDPLNRSSYDLAPAPKSWLRAIAEEAVATFRARW